ncbi:MAG: hypothetical protein OMM_14989 [Candidatus Magnetoglobus multicellularis str. Araruama]|uniref:RapA2 cadherin-like domain-containing protein n=1 Tax=Candidatus Magnetoglobus multicellularis str. Araruama TaxID=890399 RepID=A0A1V1NR06_9BACT|nr:MAG: hypothetical protein OMM_14989 [Candidatus Magnetoglobus multicellularis str. Araruama]
MANSVSTLNEDVGSEAVFITVTDGQEFAYTQFTLTVINIDDNPYVANAITVADQQEDASNYDIDLTNVFSDVDNDDTQITKTIVSNSDEAIIISDNQ